MKVMCINKNGWHSFRGNVYAFVEPRTGLTGYPKYGEECRVEGISVDCYGDMLYYISGYGSIGIEAEQFIEASNELLNSEQELNRSVATNPNSSNGPDKIPDNK